MSELKVLQKAISQTKEILEFQDDICDILDDVETNTSASKGIKNTKNNVPRITSDISRKGSNILPFLKKSREEEDPFTPRSPVKMKTEEEGSISVFEATSEHSDISSYSNPMGPSSKTKKEPLIKRAIRNINV
jgi:hypothetical protein